MSGFALLAIALLALAFLGLVGFAPTDWTIRDDNVIDAPVSEDDPR